MSEPQPSDAQPHSKSGLMIILLAMIYLYFDFLWLREKSHYRPNNKKTEDAVRTLCPIMAFI
jgi:hypothetical protein